MHSISLLSQYTWSLSLDLSSSCIVSQVIYSLYNKHIYILLQDIHLSGEHTTFLVPYCNGGKHDKMVIDPHDQS